MTNIGTDLLGADWDVFKSIMVDAHATFAQKVITWKRRTVKIDRFGEDPIESFIDTPLKVLCDWNYKRTWPVDVNNESGQDDEQSVQVYMNKEFLRVNGFLNDDGYFNYDKGFDQFIIDGKLYKSFGDTTASQMLSDDSLMTIIIKRVTEKEGHGSYTVS